MSLDQFLKRHPNPNVHVIYDEIDQKLGNNSFDIMESGTTVTAIYRASIMK